MRIKLDDRYHKGTAVFEPNGDNATLTFMTKNKIPLNLRYELQDSTWQVTSVTASDYVDNVVTLGLEKI